MKKNQRQTKTQKLMIVAHTSNEDYDLGFWFGNFVDFEIVACDIKPNMLNEYSQE